MLHIHILGNPPAHWQEGLALLHAELGMAEAPDGLRVFCQPGEDLCVESDGTAVTLTYSSRVAFYRALSLIPQPLRACSIREHARFESCGVMFDCSRNAVLLPGTIRLFLRRMALMGLNLGKLYTEDTYEVPEQPFFGYKRGRYSYDELKALDDYADLLGIELCPCIQTLGHLKRVLHWPAFAHLRDNESVLLADLDETYVFIEQMIRAASRPFRSRRIHLGMDEAHGVGMGEHLNRFGYENPHDIMGRHLRRVLDITDKYGLRAMIWSDMYFRLDGHGYYDGGMPSERAKQAVDPRVALVYWDYYHNRKADYDNAFYKHAQFDAETVFAGGTWTWAGIAPSYVTAIGNTVPALEAAMQAGAKTALCTAWGDNGAETNLLTGLLGLQLYAEMNYTGVYDEAALRARFLRCCGGDPQAFLDLDLFNRVPGMRGLPDDPVNACKFLLYQDPLIQLFEKDMEHFDAEAHFQMLVGKFARYAQENPAYTQLFDFYTALAHALTLKCHYHAHAGRAVRSGDRAGAAALAEEIPATVEALHTLRRVWRQLWEATNKPHGFEIIEVRLAGVTARMETAAEKLLAFAQGETDTVPELAEPTLPYKYRPDGTFGCSNIMEQISTTGTIDW